MHKTRRRQWIKVESWIWRRVWTWIRYGETLMMSSEGLYPREFRGLFDISIIFFNFLCISYVFFCAVKLWVFQDYVVVSMCTWLIGSCKSMMKPGWALCQPGALIKAPFGVETSVKSFVTELNIVFIHHSQHITSTIFLYVCIYTHICVYSTKIF